jgi:hypothetical protein
MRYYKKSIAIFLLLIFFFLPGFSQKAVHKPKKSTGDIGLGAGIDYGGFGIQLNQIFGPIYLTGGYGYNNVYFLPFGGLKYFVPLNEPDLIFAPYIKVIYGYNTTIIIKNGPKKFYFGITPGIGTNIRFGKTKSFGFNFDINVPVRTKNYKKDREYYKLIYSTYKPDVLPLSFSLGIQICLDK